jgi:phosphatidylglycerol:prolipoprotein diacylglycerol transferase
LVFLRRRNLDAWLFLDAIAPAALLGQALARPANFINQELYGPPTTLPWGIPILRRTLEPYTDLSRYPLESTRFHPTFAYEMVWNILAALLLIWFARQYERRLKPGTIFAGWLVLAGIGRFFIEFFRPDQPRIPGSDFTYTAVVSALMALAGVGLLLVRSGRPPLAAAEDWENRYRISGSRATGGAAGSGRAPAPRKRVSRQAELPRPRQAPKRSR